MKKTVSALVLVLGFAIFCSQALASSNSQPSIKRIIMVVLENTSYQAALNQPYFSALAKQGALFTHLSAEGHPSQPNYIAMIAGDTLGVTSDSPVNLSGKSVADLMDAKNVSWKVYAEDYPGNCFLGATQGKYVRKHVPFLSFKNIQSSPERCAKIVNSSEMDSDLANGTLPQFSFFVPNLENDGHNTGAAFADQWLSQAFGPMIADSKTMKDTLLVITFDESEHVPNSNQIYTVFVGANVVPGSTVSTPSSHYTILKTIEDAFGLGTLGKGDAQSTSVEGIWQ